MSGIRLELANPEAYSSPSEYIEQHLAPVATELHRMMNELSVPGSTAEADAVDMVSSVPGSSGFNRLDERLHDYPKHVIFDGSGYFSLPKELLRQKRVKVQFVATVYVQGPGSAAFRLVRDDGMFLIESEFHTTSQLPVTVSYRLPFGEQPWCITPDSRTYYIEAMRTGGSCLPVCRRFSLSFVYI